jgi:hypothetical protein
MTNERGKRKTPQQHKKLASLLAEGAPVGEALREAGWSERQSAKGWEAVPNAVLAQLPKKAQRLASLGKNTDKDMRKHIIRGRLLENAIKGKDGGALSAKILGSESELNMWTPDTQVGMIVLNAPQWMLDHKEELLAGCEGILDDAPQSQNER